MIRFEQMFHRTTDGGAVVRLQWGDQSSDPVRVELPNCMLGEVPLAQLDGTGVSLPTQFGELQIRVDRDAVPQRFVVSYDDQILRAGTAGSLGSTKVTPVGGVHSAYAQSIAPAPKKSNGWVIALLVVFGMLTLVAVGIISAVVVLKSKIDQSLNQVAMTLEIDDGSTYTNADQSATPNRSSAQPIPTSGQASPSGDFIAQPQNLVQLFSAYPDLDASAVAQCVMAADPSLANWANDTSDPRISRGLLLCAPEYVANAIAPYLSVPDLGEPNRSCAARAIVEGVGALPRELVLQNETFNTATFPEEHRQKLIAHVKKMCEALSSDDAARLINE